MILTPPITGGVFYAISLYLSLMKYIITESQYNLLIEQTNVYTDVNEYKKALKIYNKKMLVYKGFLELYNQRDAWSKNFYHFNSMINIPNIDNLTQYMKVTTYYILLSMDYFYRCMKGLPMDNGYKVASDSCSEANRYYNKLGKPKFIKWYKVTVDTTSGTKNYWIPLVEKPNIKKPIFKKPEPVEPVKPTITKTPTPVSTPKPTPLPIKRNIDKTKPIDFYFGNAIFRTFNYETALKFAEKLAIKNFNSNMIKVYEHPDNEKWFVGNNDKIYLNKSLYDNDANKNVYVDPKSMGMVRV